MYWKRDRVIWTSSISPNLFGKQQEATTQVNFRNQIGIYILYDNNGIVYIGRASEQTISKRLKDHTEDRLEGRWDRFSWFGIYSVNEDGTLNSPVNNLIDIENLIITFESLLIEVIEPRQNRKRGDYF